MAPGMRDEIIERLRQDVLKGHRIQGRLAEKIEHWKCRAKSAEGKLRKTNVDEINRRVAELQREYDRGTEMAKQEPVAYMWKTLTKQGQVKWEVGEKPPPYIPTSELRALYPYPR